MEKKKNILFLPKWYPNRIVPANGNFVENHALAISKYASIAVIFVRSENRKSGPKYEITEENKDGFPVVRVYFKKPAAFFKFLLPFRYWKAQKIGYHHLLQSFNQPDLCHVHVMARSGAFALYLQRRFKIPILITEHWSGYVGKSGKYKGLFRKWFTRYLVKKAALITAVSEHLRDAMLEHGLQAHYDIIPNVVDTDLFQPNSNGRNRENEGKKQMIHISTLDSPIKNVPGILEAIAALKKKRQDFVLNMVGDGPERRQQEERARKLGILGQEVTFHGEVLPDEVAKKLSIACFLLLFSEYETQSVVMLEAFSCGIPVIAPGVGGIPEHLNAQRGKVIAPSDVHSLTKTLDQLLDDYTTFDSSAIRAYAVENFSYSAVGNKFAQCYYQILEAKDH